MKKIILAGSLILLFAIGYSQNVVTQTFTSPGTGTYTVPAGIQSVTVECWGAGGGGGGAGGSGGAGGGGGGAYSKSTLSVTPGNYTVMVGVGGPFGSGPGGNGGAGADSWFNTAGTILAKGGGGGVNGGGGGPGSGGFASAGIGTTKFDGGMGGMGASGGAAQGGGGGGSSAGSLSMGNAGGAGQSGGGGTGGTGGIAPAGGGNGGNGGSNNNPASPVAGFAPGGGGGGSGAVSGGGAGASGSNGKVIVTYTQPTILNVTATTANGVYGAASNIDITITFSESVNVGGGTPVLYLETGTTDHLAYYGSGSGTNTLTFNYTVQSGNVTPDLDYISTTALFDNGATIYSTTTLNEAVVTLPSPGGAGSLGANKNIIIDGIPPFVTNIAINSSTNPWSTTNGISTGVVIFRITFNESITGTYGTQIGISTTGDVSYGSFSAGGVSNQIDVTVGSITGSGLMKCNFIDTDGVIDQAGNPVGGIGSGNGDFYSSFTGLEYYTIALPAPSSAVASFTPTGAGSTFIDLEWSHAVAPAQDPTHYVVIAAENPGPGFPTVVDGTTLADDTDATDGRLIYNVVKTAGSNQPLTFTNLKTATTYDFRIYPYTLSQYNTADNIDYGTFSTVNGASTSGSNPNLTIAPLSAGLAPSPLLANSTNQAILGFSLTSDGSQTVTDLSVGFSGSTTNKFSSYSLIRSTDNNFSTSGDNTVVNGLSISWIGTPTVLIINGMNEAITSTPANYFIVANVDGTVTGSTPSEQASSLSPTVSTGTFSGAASGPLYTFVAACVVPTLNTNFVNNTNCSLPKNGTATVTATTAGGEPTGNYTMTWYEDDLNGNEVIQNGNSNGAVGLTATQLQAGVYMAEVINNDVPGCSSTATVTIVDDVTNPTLTPSSTDNTNCNPPNGSATVVPFTLGGEPLTNYTYQWYDGSANPLGVSANTATGLTADNYSVYVTEIATGCQTNVGIPVNDNTFLPTITLGASPSVSQGTTTANLPYSGTTGSPNQYAIDFNSAAEGAGFSDVIFTTLPGTPIVITVPGGAAATTYNATITVRNSATLCDSSPSPFTVIVTPPPAPVITAVTIPDVSMKIGDLVTATITVNSSTEVFTLAASTINGYTIGGLNKSNNTTYTAQFNILAGGTDVIASASIPVSVVLTGVGGSNSPFTTAIVQANDPIDANAPVAPTIPDLNVADDTGASNTDNITNLTSALTFGGTAETGATVNIYRAGSTLIGTGIATGGAYSIDVALPTGASTITAVATDAAGNVGPASSGLSVTVDTTPPSVTLNQAGGQADPTATLPVNFTAVFSEAINPSTFASADFTFNGSAPGQTLGTLSTSDNITWTVPINATGTGTFTPLINAGGIQDLAGNNNNGSTSTDNSVTYNNAPTTQATNILFPSLTTATLNLSWSNGNGANRLVVGHAGAAVNSNPVNGTAYSANATFGNGTQIGAGNFVVFSGVGTSVTVTGLTAGTTYHFQVFEFNGSGVSSAYLTTTATGNPASASTMAAQPTTQASAITFNTVTSTSMNMTWTNGDGASRLIVARAGGSPSFSPVDGTAYTANADFSLAADVGGGDKIIFSGSGNSVSITGLVASTTYNYKIFEFNGSGVTANYATGGPNANQATTAALSSTSDIIVNGAFTVPTNIGYATFQEASNIALSGTSLEVARFDMRDGGGVSDADAATTTLTALTVDLSSTFGIIRRIALYDGSTEIAEQSVSSQSVAFTGLTLIAPDNGTKTLSFRVSFNSTITDNQQFSIRIASATANVGGSTFAAADAGGAITSTASDNNRIEVTATKLLFVQQPTTTVLGIAMSPAVTVEASDALNNRDLDFAGSVSLSSTGTLTGSPVSATFATGLGTYSTLTHTVVGTSLTMTTANVAGLTNATSNTFDITATDVTPPTVTSINYQVPANSPTNANSLTFRVTFSEDVTNINSSDFTVVASGVTTGTAVQTPVSASVYDVVVSSVAGNGTVRLDVLNSATITDLASNAYASNFTTGQVYTIDQTAPVFSATAPASSATVANTQVSYTLSEAITSGSITWTQTGGTADGGSPHVQALTGTELTVGAHPNITLTNNPTLVSGAIYSIAFNGTDAAGNTATAVTNTNVTFSTATAPVITAVAIPNVSMKIGDVVTATITVNSNTEAFTLGTSSIGGFALGTLVKSNNTTYTAQFTVTAGGTDVAAGSSIPVSVVLTGVAGSNTPFTTAIAQASDPIDANRPVFSATAPASSATVANTQVSYTLSEAITSGSITWTRTGGTADGGSPHVQTLSGTELTTGAHANITLTNNPTLVSGAIYSIAFNGTDAAGNAATTVTNTNVTFSSDATPPTVVSIAYQTPANSPTNANTLTFRVTFSESVTGVAAADFAQTVTGATTGAISVSVISQSVYNVTVASVAGVGTVRLDVSASATIVDLAGNALTGGFTAGQVYTVDTIVPVISSTSPATGSVIQSTAVSYTLSETITSGSITWTRTGGTADAGSPHVQSLTGAELATGTHTNITLTNNPTLVSGAVYSVAFSGTDAAGNTATVVTNTNVTFDNSVPTVVSIVYQNPANALTNASSLTFRVTFSEPVLNVDAADFTKTLAAGVAGGAITITPVSTSVYDVTFPVAGSGTVRLDVLGTASITDVNGNALSANFITGNVYTLDQTPPVFSNTSPASSSIVSSTQVSYTLSENLSAGTITWTRTGGTADETVHTQDLVGAELNSGAHSNILLASPPTLVAGAVYTVTFAGIDAAGNNANAVTSLNVTYTPAPINLSDIVTTSTFSYPQNIDYISFQENSDLQSSATSIVVAQFEIRDGGDSAPDADPFPTVITSLTFDLGTNSSLLRRIALYDATGQTEISGTEKTVSNQTVSFNNLNLSCDDNAVLSFTVRVSFVSEVTDNLQFSLTITEAKSESGTSGLEATDGGGATSSTANNNNRIEVMATELKFIDQPANTLVNEIMATAISIEAIDANGNRDLDFSETVGITSTGTLNTNLSVSLTEGFGVSTSDIIHSASGEGLTLITTNNAGLTDGTSLSFDIYENTSDIKLVIHSVITPTRSDEQNNVLYIENIDFFPENSVQLIDRWGNPIKSWTNFSNYANAAPDQPDFDFSGLNVGNYICVVEYKDVTSGNKKSQTQMITVLK